MLAVFTYYKYEILYNIQSHLKKIENRMDANKADPMRNLGCGLIVTNTCFQSFVP